MASIHRVKRSKYWYGSLWLPGGKQIIRSTGETEKTAALAVVLQWERVAKAPPSSEPQAKRVLEDIIRLTGGAVREKTSCREFANRWMKEKEGTVSPATLAFYKQAVEVWLKWMGPMADQDIDQVRPEHLVEWRNAESKRVSTGTVNQRIKAVRVLLKAAGARFGFESPATEVKRLKKDRDATKRRPFTRAELQGLLTHCTGPWKLMVLLGLQTGQRLGDIARMQWNEVRDGSWNLTTRKTATRLRIPLSKEVLDLLVRRKADQKAAAGKPAAEVFPELASKITDKGVGRLSNDFGRILFKAGLRTTDPHDERGEDSPKADSRRQLQELSFHSLRHTARTWLEEAGQPKAVIDAFIGHEGDTGKIYTTVGEEALRNAAAALAAAGT